MTFSQASGGKSIAEGDKDIVLNSCRLWLHNLEAEKSILNTFLLDNQVIGSGNESKGQALQSRTRTGLRHYSALESILTKTFGDQPPVEGIGTWRECLTGHLSLYFEAQAPSPKGYVDWLGLNLAERQLIPYIRDAAAREGLRTLEGATHFDAVIVNSDNGFALLIEAKVLSDISPYVTFDNRRNQMARCIDVMLEQYTDLPAAFGSRKPERSLFALLTPEVFRRHPQSRLYGWLFQEYRSDPSALARDLPHRTATDWPKISSRIGWIAFEDIESQSPGACPWFARQIEP